MVGDGVSDAQIAGDQNEGKARNEEFRAYSL
jgi:hypothetical protein